MYQETLPTNRINSNSDNEYPVFGLFPTKVFYPSDELVEQIVELLKVVGDETSIST